MSSGPAPEVEAGPPDGPIHSREAIPDRPAEQRTRWRRFRGHVSALGRGIWRKGEQDNVFFLAGAISFDVLVAFIPLVLTVVGIAGTVLRREAAQGTIFRYLDQAIPQAVGLPYERILTDLASNSAGILSVGTLLFLWISTRLVGTLRIALREIFDMTARRGIVAGKLFDIKMVLMAGTLFVVNVVLTVGVRLSAEFVTRTAGIQPADVPVLRWATALWPQLVAFGTLWIMFLLIYRYLPPQRIRWSTAVIAATFTTIMAELLKFGFTSYVQNVARFDEFWGNVATFVILVLWIYYTSLVFILGGEVAQVVTMQRIRKRQKLRLS